MENTQTAGSRDMELINRLARRKLSPEEVYTFPVVLCDNETDRDFERFSIPALERLAELFVGKTGIFDHDPKGRNQTARIYSAELVSDPGHTTRSGEVYHCVRAKAYMMRTRSNEDFIREIDGGIKKEVSVSCSAAKKVCSICGADKRRKGCNHVKGRMYGGRLCENIIGEPTDAYEWSFVAVPAQPAAGITKALADGRETEIKALRRELTEQRAEIDKARADLIAEIVRLGQFCVPAYTAEAVNALCAGMTVDELLTFKEQTRKLVKTARINSVLQSGDEAARKPVIGGFKLKK
ncbi:MAG: hypothetical protein K6C68_00405 [Ruminococcus sp.]|nr:hypothetical protein [Ruminococcus sp.]